MTTPTLIDEHVPAAQAAMTVPEELKDSKPFAAIKLGNSRFEVADGAAEGALMYRLDADSPWVPLYRTLEHGWQEICAEILISTRDGVHDYAVMHTIKITPDKSDATVLEYDLFGYKWSMEILDHGVKINVPSVGELDVADLDLDQFPSRREAAIYALVHSVPELVKEFEKDVFDWATRLSAGATVEPIM